MVINRLFVSFSEVKLTAKTKYDI